MLKINYMKYNIKKLISGFTILEVVISIGIITVGLLGVSSLVLQNIQVEVNNRDYLIASMLAQEGLELVRNIRDVNCYNNRNWKNGEAAGSANDIVQGGNYIISKDGNINNSITNINNAGARLNIVSGFYDHGAGVASPFYRLISVSNDAADYITASSTIKWQVRGKTNYYTAATKL
jgi:Tfp pilus assembly protein PilV